jgi:hypothetical protein
MHYPRLDLVGGTFPVNGLEPEMLAAIDDHPGLVVAATGLPLPPGHVVCEAFSPRSPARVHRLRCSPTRAPRRFDVGLSHATAGKMLLKTWIGELQASTASRVVLASRLGGLLAYRGT